MIVDIIRFYYNKRKEEKLELPEDSKIFEIYCYDTRYLYKDNLYTQAYLIISNKPFKLPNFHTSSVNINGLYVCYLSSVYFTSSIEILNIKELNNLIPKFYYKDIGWGCYQGYGAESYWRIGKVLNWTEDGIKVGNVLFCNPADMQKPINQIDINIRRYDEFLLALQNKYSLIDNTLEKDYINRITEIIVLLQ